LSTLTLLQIREELKTLLRDALQFLCLHKIRLGFLGLI